VYTDAGRAGRPNGRFEELMERIETVGDDADLQEVYDTERHLLYVACTRARDHLLVTGVDPVSEFLDDFARGGRAATMRRIASHPRIRENQIDAREGSIHESAAPPQLGEMKKLWGRALENGFNSRSRY
jgi:ATP-dependent exoDNAse (exonuclease V) beta subunit